MAGRISPEQAKALGLHDAPSGSISPEQAKALGLHDEAPTEQPSRLAEAAQRLAEAAQWWLSQPKVGPVPIPLGEGDALTKVASFTNGVTQGLAPAIGAASDVVGAAASGAIPAHPLDDFSAKREGLRRFYTGAESEEPALSLAGAMMTPLPGAKARGLGGAALRIGTAAGLGALNAEERAPGAEALDSGAHGAELAAGVGAAAEGLPLVGRMAPALRRMAEVNALKAGFGGGQISNKLQRLGYDTANEGAAVGRRMLDEGLVPFFGGSVADRAAAMRQKAGGEVGTLIEQAASTGKPFDAWSAARSAESKMRTPVASDPSIDLNALEEAASGKARDFIGKLESEGDRVLSPAQSWREANRFKSKAWDAATFKDSAALEEEMYRRAVSGLRGSIEQQVERGVGPGAGAALRDANERHGFASDVLNLANDEETRDLVRQSKLGTVLRSVGAAATTGGAVSAVAGPVGVLGGVAAGALFGAPQRIAHGADAAAKLASLAPKSSIGTPAATSAAARKLWEWYGVAPKDEKDISKQYADQELPGL